MAKRNNPISSQKPITLDGFHPYFDLEECLTFMARAMERSGWDQYDLPDYQQRLYHDLHNPLDEEAIDELQEFWQWDLEKLYERGRQGWGRGRAPDKPQIDVWIEITSKGNLKAEWFPRDGGFHYTPNESDFPHFRRSEHRRASFDSRPSNEPFFLHEFETAQRRLGADRSPTDALNTPLLAACAQVADRLKQRLQRHFRVRMCRDVFLEWSETEDAPDASQPWRQRSLHRLERWEIADPAERARLAELNELANLETTAGFSEEQLVQTKKELELHRSKTGPAPAAHTLATRLTRELKKQGHPATEGKVKRALDLIERHRARSNIVQLRPSLD
jgi:hypothetical protein